MRKQPLIIEWYIAKDDTEWTKLCPQPVQVIAPGATPAAYSRLFSPRFLAGVAAIVLLLAGVGAWWLRTNQVALRQPAASGTATPPTLVGAVAPDRDSAVTRSIGNPSNPGRWLPHRRDVRDVHATVQPAESSAYVFEAVQPFEVQGDLAVARVVMYTEFGEPAYRQTRFYRRIATRWQQTPPNADLWGPERSLTTLFFSFRFRQQDAPTVSALASQVDDLYTTLRRNVGSPITLGTERQLIEVSVTQTPGYATHWFRAPKRIIVPSPAVYMAPVELSDAELLAQSLALPLLEQVLVQASERYQIRAAWQPLVTGLALWQLWDLDLPLSAWREEVVQWLYVDLPAADPGQPFPLPARYQELCATHKLWMPSPLQMYIPLLCGDQGVTAEYYPIRYARTPPLRLNQLAAPATLVAYPTAPAVDLVIYAGQMVDLATLIEYALAAYGQERLPALLACLGQHESWDTLLPAVFGVSAVEFEAGWQMYLATHYGVPVPSLFAH